MILENGMPIKTEGKQLDLNFDLRLRGDNVFGTVFRVITDANENIDLMYRVSENDIRLPFLLAGEEVFLIQKQARVETWLNVTLSLNPGSGQIVLQYDGEEIEIMHEKLKGTKSVRIAFGYCPFEGFVLDDIASVNIKNVSLKRDNREIRLWRMKQHVGDICYDEVAGVPAVGENTQWIMDDYITWRKIYEQALNTAPAIAFDSIRDQFFITTDTEIYTFSPSQKIKGIHVDTSMIRGGEYAANAPNQLIYIYSEQQLVSYNLTEDIYSVFDLTQSMWKSKKKPAADHDYWNSSVVFNPVDSALISFGGYGHYLYNNELLFCYPLHGNKPPQRVYLSSIDPRYSPASVLVDNNLYIFGGRGSPTGRQELSPRNYYDLYSVNLTDKTVKQLWSLTGSPENGDFIPSENMIYDSENQCFYVFTSQSGGVLMKIDTVHTTLEPMSLPIGISFNTHYIYTNLFFTPGQQKLYASILLSEVSGESTLTIYEMDYPSVSVKSVQQGHTETGQKQFRGNWSYIFGLIFLCITVVAIAYYYRKKKRAGQKKEAGVPLEAVPAVHTPAFEEERTGQYYNFTRGCICFLGRFRVFDKKGNDITSLFSPTLTSLLIALVCYSAKDSKEISGNQLIRLLWSDKSEEAAKNNRNVYMSKLRTILEEVGNLKIVNQNSYWRIQIEDDTLCDYLEIMKHFEEKGNQDLEKMLELLTRGAMLPNMEVDWIDTFKNDFANTAIDFLCRILKKNDLADSLKLKIADTLFQYDFLSEEALQIKCSVLYQQSKIGLAKTVYDTFCNLYRSSLGTDYQYSFMQVIEPE
jgi:DNA-binding SARP family transcriptional activator